MSIKEVEERMPLNFSSFEVLKIYLIFSNLKTQLQKFWTRVVKNSSRRTNNFVASLPLQVRMHSKFTLKFFSSKRTKPFWNMCMDIRQIKCISESCFLDRFGINPVSKILLTNCALIKEARNRVQKEWVFHGGSIYDEREPTLQNLKWARWSWHQWSYATTTV